jgi:hypothetical protein
MYTAIPSFFPPFKGMWKSFFLMLSSTTGFTELHAKLDADTLLEFAIHCGQNETQSRKSARVKLMRVHSWDSVKQDLSLHFCFRQTISRAHHAS